MNVFPKHTTCGECNRQVKLKRASWELWTDGEDPVGACQQRTCRHCHSIVLAAIGNEEFITTMLRHYATDADHVTH